MSIFNKVADFFGFSAGDDGRTEIMNEQDAPMGEGRMPEEGQPVGGGEMSVTGSDDAIAGGDESQPDVVMPEQSPLPEEPEKTEE